VNKLDSTYLDNNKLWALLVTSTCQIFHEVSVNSFNTTYSTKESLADYVPCTYNHTMFKDNNCDIIYCQKTQISKKVNATSNKICGVLDLPCV
jgi:hypothetical protein